MGDRQSVMWSRARGVPAIAINFGPFKDVGMAATYADSMLAVGLKPLHPSEACSAFERIGLASRLVYVGISIKLFRKANTTKGPWSFVDYLHHRPLSSPENSCVSFEKSDKGTQSQEASPTIYDIGFLSDFVKDELTRVLGQDIAVADHFAQYNIDSLAALELSTALSKSIGKELPGTLVYDFPSIKELAQHLHQILSPNGIAAHPMQALAASVVPRQEVDNLIGLRIASRLPAASLMDSFDLDAIMHLPYPRYTNHIPIMQRLPCQAMLYMP